MDNYHHKNKNNLIYSELDSSLKDLLSCDKELISSHCGRRRQTPGSGVTRAEGSGLKVSPAGKNNCLMLLPERKTIKTITALSDRLPNLLCIA